MRAVIEEGAGSRQRAAALAGRLSQALGEPIDTGVPALNRLGVTAERIAGAGVPPLGTGSACRTPRAPSSSRWPARSPAGRLQLEPGADVPSTLLGLTEGCGMDERTAKAIILRALHWPDTFPARQSHALQRAAGVANEHALLGLAERWRPWRGLRRHSPVASPRGLKAAPQLLNPVARRPGG